MRIRFLKAKDRVILIEEGTLAKTWEKLAKADEYNQTQEPRYRFMFPVDRKFFDERITSLPKGTELIVSQVYIRNKGWSDDSINFILPKEYRVSAEPRFDGEKVRVERMLRVALEDVEEWEIDRVRS